MATVTGTEANIYIGDDSGAPTDDHSTWAISDFSLTFDRGTAEQELLGEHGNYFTQGSLSVEGSLSQCRFAASGGKSFLLDNLVDTDNHSYIRISGSIGSTELSFYFVSCQVTSYEVSIGDADTITEASIDFQVLDPHLITYTAGVISDYSG